MKRFFYLFLILFSFQITVAQSTPAEVEISEKLKKISSTTNIDSKLKEKNFLELKAQSEKLNYKLGILISGDYLMELYLSQGKNEDVSKLGDQLKIIAKNEKDIYGYISNIYSKNALALGYLGLSDASLKDLKKAMNYANDVKDKNTKSYLLSQFYHEMGLQYNLKRFENKNLRDSLIYTYNKSIEMAKQISDSSKAIKKDVKYDMIGFNHMRLGIFYLEQNNIKGSLELAEKHLNKAQNIYQDKRYNIPQSNKIMLLNQLSWLYMEKKEYKKSIDYANRALELEKKHRFPEHRVESFEFLASSYLELGEKEKSKLYMSEYSFLKDSIADVDRTNANKTVKKIVTEVNKEHEENSKKQLIIIGSLVLIAIATTIILWRRKNKTLRKNYEQIIEKLKKEALPHEPEITIKTNDLADEQQLSENKNIISSHTEIRILNGLQAFEKSEKFLKADFTMGNLVVHLNTNTKYLSDIIKSHKSQNFNSYLNTLRINYINNKLYNEPKYREYKIAYLAEECGYSSPQVFTMAFKKVNGVNPSYFIQNLKDDNL